MVLLDNGRRGMMVSINGLPGIAAGLQKNNSSIADGKTRQTMGWQQNILLLQLPSLIL